MKIIIGICLLVGSMAFGSANSIDFKMGEPENFQPNLKQGNWEVGGSFALGYSTSSGFVGYLDPRGLYFFSDRLAAGLSAGLSFTSARSTNSVNGVVGPALSYYFWKQERLATYLSQDILFGIGSGALSKSALGLNYFFTPSVSFGPSIQYQQFIGPESGNGFLQIRGNFSIFL